MAVFGRCFGRLIGVLLLGGGVGCVQSMPLPPAPPSQGSSPQISSPVAASREGSIRENHAGLTGPFSTEMSRLPDQSNWSVSGVNRWRPSVAARPWKYIVLHHTAADSGSVESIHETHLQRKDSSGHPWLGIGYHFVIGNGKGMTDGEIEPTFRWREQLHGAHAGGTNPEYNQQGIGIVLVGNFQKQRPTQQQLLSVKRLVRSLAEDYGIASTNIIGHKDIRATECPGELFPLQDVVADLDESFDPKDVHSLNPHPQLVQQKAATWR